MIELATIELDMKDILFLLVMSVSIATNIVAVWMLRHNIPELHDDVKGLKERFHELDKGKLTREIHTPQTMTSSQPGQWPAVTATGDHSSDAERYQKGPSKP